MNDFTINNQTVSLKNSGGGSGKALYRHILDLTIEGLVDIVRFEIITDSSTDYDKYSFLESLDALAMDFNITAVLPNDSKIVTINKLYQDMDLLSGDKKLVCDYCYFDVTTSTITSVYNKEVRHVSDNSWPMYY